MLALFLGALFLLLLLSLLWAVVVLSQLSLLWALVPTIGVVLAIAGALVYRMLSRHRAAGELERALSAQADAQERSSRPDMQPEIQAMRAEFQKALASLKSSKLARGGQDALSVLPWYLIVGPPGAGKSTALRNSGLKFPYLSARGGVRGVGGTRNCDWWLTQEAVILDTAGRYTSEEDDREEWLAFLDTLARARPRRPINGLIVAVSVSELLTTTPAQGAAELGQRLRERLDEVTARLRMVVPVYLLVTKCDLLAGFVETFNELPRPERGQIWGVTLPLGEQGDAPGERVQEWLGELSAVLEERALQRLGRERRVEARERIYRFPRQFQTMCPSLVELVQALFAESPYQDTPLLRGVYFTSGTQEGRPLDLVMKAMAEAFNLREVAAQVGEPVTEPRSYFLRDVFSQVMFKDQRLAVRSSAETRRRRRLGHAYAGGALVLALLIMLFPTLSFFANREEALAVGAEARALLDHPGTGDELAAGLQALEPLRKRVARLHEWETGGAPLLFRFGMYQDSLYGAAAALYASGLRRLLLEPVLAQDVAALKALARREREGLRVSPQDEWRGFYQLRLHLWLTGPRAPGEPAPVEREVLDELRARVGRNVDPELLAAHASLYLKLLATHPSIASPRDTETVGEARKALRELDIVPLLLDHLVQSVGSTEELGIPQLLSVDSVFKARRPVRAAFTKKAWKEVVHKWLDSPLEDSTAWVLDRSTSPAALASLQGRLRSAYLCQYKWEWRDFLRSLELAAPSAQELGFFLDGLDSGKPPPVEKLLGRAAREAQLEDPADKKAGPSSTFDILKSQLGKSGGEAPGSAASDEETCTPAGIQEEFSSLIQFAGAARKGEGEDGGEPPVASYQRLLGKLREAVQADPGPALPRQVTGLRDSARALIQGQGTWPRNLEKLLLTPFDLALGGAIGQRGKSDALRWCKEWMPLRRELVGRYPFVRDGRQDAPLEVVLEVYAKGKVAEFVRDHTFIQPQPDGSYVWNPDSNEGANYRPALLGFLRDADRLSSVFAHAGDGAPLFEFTVHLGEDNKPVVHPSAAKVVFKLDDTSVQFQNTTSVAQDFKWPGSARPHEAAIEVWSKYQLLAQVASKGDWALFHLLDSGEVIRAGDRDFTMRWRLNGAAGGEYTVDVDFTLNRRLSPLFGDSPPGRKLFQLFRTGTVIPPDQIVRNGSGCGS